MTNKRKIKVAVLVSGGGTNLQAILDAEKEGRLPSAEVEIVISDKQEAFALKRAAAAGKKTAVVIKKGNPSFEADIESYIDKNGIELIVLAGFMCILSDKFTKKYEGMIINVHPSLIPSFCGKGYYGLHVHEAALSYGVKVTGATVHFVNEIPDGGCIIMQKAVDVMDGDTPEILQKRVMEQAEWKILPASVELISKKMLEAENERV